MSDDQNANMSDEDRHPNRREGEADPDQETNDAQPDFQPFHSVLNGNLFKGTSQPSGGQQPIASLPKAEQELSQVK